MLSRQRPKDLKDLGLDGVAARAARLFPQAPRRQRPNVRVAAVAPHQLSQQRHGRTEVRRSPGSFAAPPKPVVRAIAFKQDLGAQEPTGGGVSARQLREQRERCLKVLPSLTGAPLPLTELPEVDLNVRDVSANVAVADGLEARESLLEGCLRRL